MRSSSWCLYKIRGRYFQEGRTMASGQLQVVLRHVHKLAGTAGSGDVTDGQLLERFVTQRDEAAFELLVRRHDLLHAMFMTQVKLVLAVLLTVTVVTVGARF